MPFLLALVGYGTGIFLTITLFLKPFRSRIGLWVGPGTLEVGTPGSDRRLHEALGNAYIPVITVIAFAMVVGTTQALRWLMRKRNPRSVY